MTGCTGCPSRRQALASQEKARALCETLQVPWSRDDWHDALKFVDRERRARRDKNTVDNRLLGLESVSDLPHYMPIVSFYFSLQDGTGTVDRYLGMHACFLNNHLGAPCHDMAGACLEIVKEGPKDEAELLTKDDAGTLLLTPYSRNCAKTWRAQYG
eukprot:3519486-Karenia_brevis.AAC.1